MQISDGKQVSFEYTLKLDDQSVVDTNVGREPLTYTHGGERLIPGLQKGMEGMAAGETRTVTVSPDEGYGGVDPEAFREVDKKLVPETARKVGAQLQGKTQEGKEVFPRVVELKDEKIVLDFNHPLAGKTLHFDVKVLQVSQG